MSASPYMNRFQIRDLEEFSGIKAHTIRIWEKRYGLLTPDRTETNIRYYGMDELKTLLNVAYLNKHGHKISKIAKLTVVQREQLVKDIAGRGGDKDDALNSLKMAMLAFDEAKLDTVSTRYRAKAGFRGLVEDIYLPLLEHIGVLWQTNSICPSHEHFVSNYIRQRILAEVDAIPPPGAEVMPMHVLFLPENEIHELGLLYVTYLLRASGRRTLYLGQSVPMEDLGQIAGMVDGPMVFISFITAFPQLEHLPMYLKGLTGLLPMDRSRIWLCGGQVARAQGVTWPDGVLAFAKFRELMAHVDSGS